MTVTVTRTEVARGEQQRALGSGFEPGTVVTATQHSADPLDLGGHLVGPDGTVTIAWTIRADERPGPHTIELLGPAGITASASFTVTDTPAAGGIAGAGGEATPASGPGALPAGSLPATR